MSSAAETEIAGELRRELVARGFSEQLESPHRTMVLADIYETAKDLADLLDVMVARREKIFASVAVVGEVAAKNSYDDVLLVVDAVKAVIGCMTLPPDRQS